MVTTFECSFRLKMEFSRLVVGVLLLNGQVLADCTRKQENNSWNVVKWIMRNIKIKI